MTSLIDLFNQYYFSHLHPYGYLVVLALVIIEGGDFTLFVTAFLTSQGVFSLPVIFVVFLIAMTLSGFEWFWIGAYIFKKDSRLGRWAERIARPFDRQIAKRPFYAILISKFAFGIHRPVLSRLHAQGVLFKKFIKMDFVANLIWIISVGGLGYFFGVSFTLIRPYFKFGEIILLVGIIIFVVIEHWVRKEEKEKLALDNLDE